LNEASLFAFARIPCPAKGGTAGVNGMANRDVALQSEVGLASAQFRFDTPSRLGGTAGSFIGFEEQLYFVFGQEGWQIYCRFL